MLFKKTTEPYSIGFTDDELIRVAMTAAGQFIKKNPWNLQLCMDAELTAIKAAYKEKYHRHRSQAFKPEELSAIAAAYDRLKDTLAEKSLKKLTSMKKTEKTQAINTTTAKAILSSILEETGLKYNMICQRYRLKIMIGLERGSVVMLHVHYKDIMGKDMQALAPAIQALNQLVAPVSPKKKAVDL